MNGKSLNIKCKNINDLKLKQEYKGLCLKRKKKYKRA